MKTTSLIAATALSSMIKEAQYTNPSNEKQDDSLQKMYIKWIQDGNVFSPAGDITVKEDLKNSAYRVKTSLRGVFFERVKPKTAELYKFKSGPMEEVLSEIDKFWSLKDDYSKLGLLYSRGILLYGPPGSGKTSILHQVSEMIVSKGDVVFYADNIRALSEALKAFRSVEPDRRVVVILEDADEFVQYDQQPFLHLLDGQDSIDGVVYLATTNYINNFPPRLVRSGRFDKKIEVPQPPKEGRLVYFQNKLKGNDMATDAEIEKLAEETDGMSFGDLQEIVTAHFALKEPLKDVLKRLGKDIDMDNIVEYKKKEDDNIDNNENKEDKDDKSDINDAPIEENAVYSNILNSLNKIYRAGSKKHSGIDFDKLKQSLEK